MVFSFVLQPSNGVAVKVNLEEKLLDCLTWIRPCSSQYFKISSLFHTSPHLYDHFILCDPEQISL